MLACEETATAVDDVDGAVDELARRAHASQRAVAAEALKAAWALLARGSTEAIEARRFAGFIEENGARIRHADAVSKVRRGLAAARSVGAVGHGARTIVGKADGAVRDAAGHAASRFAVGGRRRGTRAAVAAHARGRRSVRRGVRHLGSAIGRVHALIDRLRDILDRQVLRGRVRSFFGRSVEQLDVVRVARRERREDGRSSDQCESSHAAAALPCGVDPRRRTSRSATRRASASRPAASSA